MIQFTLIIFNIFGNVYTRDGTISLCQRDASARIVLNHKVQYTSFGSFPLTPTLVTKWHDRHRYLLIHHVSYLMSLSGPRNCSKTLRVIIRYNVVQMYTFVTTVTETKTSITHGSRNNHPLPHPSYMLHFLNTCYIINRVIMASHCQNTFLLNHTGKMLVMKSLTFSRVIDVSAIPMNLAIPGYAQVSILSP